MLGKPFQLRKINFSIKHAVSRFILSFIVSLLIAYFPSYETLSTQATSMLFILSFSAFLWMTGAIPSFAVSFLIIALEILLLGYPDLNFDSNSKEWLYYLKPWSSPLIFLF